MIWRRVVLSWSKRWLIVTAILRPASRIFRAMRTEPAIGVGDGLFAEDVDTVGDRNVGSPASWNSGGTTTVQKSASIFENASSISVKQALSGRPRSCWPSFTAAQGRYPRWRLPRPYRRRCCCQGNSLHAQRRPEAADADVDHSLCHISPFPLPGPLVRACVPKDGRLAFRARGRFRRIRPARV